MNFKFENLIIRHKAMESGDKINFTNKLNTLYNCRSNKSCFKIIFCNQGNDEYIKILRGELFSSFYLVSIIVYRKFTIDKWRLNE